MFKIREIDYSDCRYDRVTHTHGETEALWAFAKEAAFASHEASKKMQLIDEEGTVYAEAFPEDEWYTKKRKLVLFEKSFINMPSIVMDLMGAFQVEVK